MRLPGSLTEIADDAFDGPDKVTVLAEFDSYAYRWAVKNGYIPPYSCEENEDGTLTVTGYEGEDTELEIPEVINGKTVSAIGDGAFRDNAALTSVAFPTTLTRIGADAFNGCVNLSRPYLASIRLSEIGDRAFYGVNYRVLRLPRTIKHIGEDAFTNLTTINAYWMTYGRKWAMAMQHQDPDIAVYDYFIAYSFIDTELAHEGDPVTCSALAIDEDVVSIRWQRAFDGLNWTDCEGEGADQAEYTFTASSETCGCSYRLAATDSTGTYYSREVGVGLIPDHCEITSAYVCGNTISLSWDAISDSVTYTLYMTGPDGTETALAEDIWDAFYDVTDLEPETAYTFRVEARFEDEDEETRTGSPVTVTTQNYRTGTVYRALLIGQVNFVAYENCPDSLGDVNMMSEMLQSVTGPLGNAYSYFRGVDLTVNQVHEAIQTTFADADEDDVSLFFIATHGLEGSSTNESDFGALTASDDEGRDALIYDTMLAEWLSEIPGEVVVILEACSSGSMIYDASGSAGREEALAAMNAAAISAFRSADPGLSLDGVSLSFDQAGNAAQAPSLRLLGALRKPKFHVLASSAHRELSYGYTGSILPHTKFTYSLYHAVGQSGAMPCDTNGDGLASMKELADFIDDFEDPYNADFIQHTQIYPENSDYALFCREN